MERLTYEQLLSACRSGGPSVLVQRTLLEPAAGEFASIAPAKFTDSNSDSGVFAFEPRFVDGEQVEVVIVDSKQSVLNRIEAELTRAIVDEDPVISRVPRIAVTYPGADGHEVTYTDLELPHRAFDGHIRAGKHDGQPVTQTDAYRAARNATPANARALLELSPGSLVFGSWDATRKAHQGRWRSVLVGEIIGVVPEELAVPAAANGRITKKGGARVDPVAMQINVDGKVLSNLAETQRDELSQKTFDNIKKQTAKLKDGDKVSASSLGFGGIPPTLSALAGVPCSRIIRSYVLSFAALRQMRFGAGTEGDAACRALLAAWALAGMARSDGELYLRANCDLRESGPTVVELDQRGGQKLELRPLTVEEADAVLAQAIENAQNLAQVSWNGQIFDVVGESAVLAGAAEPTADGE